MLKVHEARGQMPPRSSLRRRAELVESDLPGAPGTGLLGFIRLHLLAFQRGHRAGCGGRPNRELEGASLGSGLVQPHTTLEGTLHNQSAQVEAKTQTSSIAVLSGGRAAEQRCNAIGLEVPRVSHPKSIDHVGRQWTDTGDDKPTRMK